MHAVVPVTSARSEAFTGESRTSSWASATADRVAAFALGTAVAYGALAQGAFYAHQSETVALAVAAAAATRVLARRRPEPYVVVCTVVWLAFGAWTLGRGIVDGAGYAGVPAATLAAVGAAAAWTGGDLLVAARRVLHAVVLTAGVAVAGSGWIGVALHRPPLALPSYEMWRASATMTYANSAAAFLVLALFVAVAVLPSCRLPSRLVVAVLLLGLLATMSRAGLLALAVGALVYAVLVRDRARDVLRWWPVLPAAAAGFAGLLPSVPEHASPAPVTAVVGLAVGGAILLATHRAGTPTGDRARLLGGAGLAVATSAVVVAVALSFWALWPTAVAGIASTRFTTSSPERADLTRVTLSQFAVAPLVGVGPGNLDLTYVDHRGVPVRAQYTHDEYLQTAAETGVVGLGLVLAGASALAVGAVRRRHRSPRRAAGALAVLAAAVVHGAFDFLWHIAVLPLVLVLSVVTLLPSPESP